MTTEITNLPPFQLAVAETAHLMVVDHADRLHEGVADGRPHEAEAALAQLLAHGLGLGGLGRDVGPFLEAVLPRSSADEAPEEAREPAGLVAQTEAGAGVGDRGV